MREIIYAAVIVAIMALVGHMDYKAAQITAEIGKEHHP